MMETKKGERDGSQDGSNDVVNRWDSDEKLHRGQRQTN